MKIKIPDIMISRLFEFERVERRSKESEIDICRAVERMNVFMLLLMSYDFAL